MKDKTNTCHVRKSGKVTPIYYVINKVSSPKEAILSDLKQKTARAIKDGFELSNIPVIFYRVQAKDSVRDYDFYIKPGKNEMFGSSLRVEGMVKYVTACYQVVYNATLGRADEDQVSRTALESACGLCMSKARNGNYEKKN